MQKKENRAITAGIAVGQNIVRTETEVTVFGIEITWICCRRQSEGSCV